MKAYETVIGLEVHVELATKSKIFCGCSTEFGGDANTHCCPVCTGMPGTLPVLNKKVVEYAISAGLALNCSITRECRFDRKNYFYPDLPKAYQVSQLYLPICRDGYIEIEAGREEVSDNPCIASAPLLAAGSQESEEQAAIQTGQKKKIRIHEIHMEEDAGKLIHDPWEDATLIDYNRCGVPLIEIVTEPDMRSAEEVIAYLEKLKDILSYLKVSDCKMQEGSLRVDINLSVREASSTVYGTRTEMKNMNSFKAIARAVKGERKRQIELLESGKKVVQETRRWDDNKDTSFAMRSKEDAMDYRYFPEPDLAPIYISEEWLKEIKSREPELRDAKLLRYVKEYNIPRYDAEIITSSKRTADIFEESTLLCGNAKEVSNWLMVEMMRLMKEEGIEPEDLVLFPEKMADFVKMIDAGIINRTVAKEVFEQMFRYQADPVRYVEEQGLSMVNDDGLVREVIEKVILNNDKSVRDYKNGKEKAIGFLIGQTMKELKGKADPDIVNRLMKEMLTHA